MHYYEGMCRALYKLLVLGFKGTVFLNVSRFHRFHASHRTHRSSYVQSGCTLQEAAIVASGLAKVKVPLVPLMHSAAALIRLANMD